MTKEDIKQEFKGVEGINEAKKIYNLQKIYYYNEFICIWWNLS